MPSDDPMCVCGDRRSSHRLGRAGCKEPDCGCDRFETAEDRPAAPAEPAPAAPADTDLPPIHTEQQRRVLVRYAAGASPGLIITETDLNREFVTACVADLAKSDRKRALRLVQEYDARTSAAAKPPAPKRKAAPAKATPAPAPPPEEREERVRVATAVLDVTTAHAEQAELNGASFPAPAVDGLAELLRRGDASADEQCRTLAAQIRHSIDALHARLAEVAAEQVRRDAALARVAQARAELDAALAELAALGSDAPADVTTTPPSTEETL